MSRLGIVYEIRNTVNGKRYVGSSVSPKKRKDVHFGLLRRGKHHSIILQNAFNKHGESAFVFSVLEGDIPENHLIEREQYWLNKLQPEYNIAKFAYSGLGIKRTDEFKTKLRAAVLGRRHTDEARANMSVAQSGKVVSEETRAKLRARVVTDETRIKIGLTSKGRTYGEETRKKLSIISKNRVRTEEHSRKISEALKGNKCALGYKRTPEECAKIGEVHSKLVNQLNKDTGEFIRQWPSARQAARELGIGPTGITGACRGELKTSGGYKWTYVDGG